MYTGPKDLYVFNFCIRSLIASSCSGFYFHGFLFHESEYSRWLIIDYLGTSFLQYLKVPINYCNSFLHGVICSCSSFLEVSGGITMWSAIHQVSRNIMSILGHWCFSGGISMPVSWGACHTAVTASPTFSGESPWIIYPIAQYLPYW